MKDHQTPFRQLPGFGPATESRLHRNGIHTWAALADILDALARVRGVDVEKLRRLRDEARRQTEDADDDESPLDERTSRFVVSVTVGPDGQVRRTSITNALSGAPHRFTGLSATDLITAIEKELKAAAEADRGANDRRADDPHSAVEAAASTTDGTDRRTPPIVLPEMPDDGPLRFTASSVVGETRTIEAGPVIGGTKDDVVLEWDTSDIDSGNSDLFGYTTTMSARPYGTRPSSWTMLGQKRGTARRGETVELNLNPSSLTRGVHRLVLSVQLRPGAGNGAREGAVPSR